MYPVDLHMHTVASTHAYSTLSDYIAEAHRKGIKLFAITDHGPDMADAPHHWHFINMRIWPRIVDGVGILRGIEANIKNIEGEIDCSGPMFTSWISSSRASMSQFLHLTIKTPIPGNDSHDGQWSRAHHQPSGKSQISR